MTHNSINDIFRVSKKANNKKTTKQTKREISKWLKENQRKMEVEKELEQIKVEDVKLTINK